jgi:hypothetical protein
MRQVTCTMTLPHILLKINTHRFVSPHLYHCNIKVVRWRMTVIYIVIFNIMDITCLALVNVAEVFYILSVIMSCVA